MPKLQGKYKQFCSKSGSTPSGYITCDVYEKLAKKDLIGKSVLVINPINKKKGNCTIGYNTPNNFVSLYDGGKYCVSSDDRATHQITSVSTKNIQNFQKTIKDLCY